MLARAITICVLGFGALLMWTSDAVGRSCGAWGCRWGSTVMCAELQGVPKSSKLVVYFDDITIEAVCAGPQGQVVNGTASHRPFVKETEVFEDEDPGTGKVTACVEVDPTVPEDDICNNLWTKFPGSDAMIYYSYTGIWEDKKGKTLDTDEGFCEGEPERDPVTYMPKSGLGSCDCTETNPD